MAIVDLDGNGKSDIINFASIDYPSIEWNFSSKSKTIFKKSNLDLSHLNLEIRKQRRFSDINSDGLPDIYAIKTTGLKRGRIFYALHERYDAYFPRNKF